MGDLRPDHEEVDRARFLALSDLTSVPIHPVMRGRLRHALTTPHRLDDPGDVGRRQRAEIHSCRRLDELWSVGRTVRAVEVVADRLLGYAV